MHTHACMHNANNGKYPCKKVQNFILFNIHQIMSCFVSEFSEITAGGKRVRLSYAWWPTYDYIYIYILYYINKLFVVAGT